MIYPELIRYGYRVAVGRTGKYGIDSVAVKAGQARCVQVCATVRDEEALSRKLRSLLAVHDPHPKVLLTLDDEPDTDTDGIHRRNALEWLPAA